MTNAESRDVTVVIPTFNRSALILRALESVRAQSCPPNAIIVVDDHSTDDTVNVVERWSSECGIPVEVDILPQNCGAAAARNRGIKLAQTEFIAFLDADDAYESSALERLVAPLRTSSESVLSFADATIVSTHGEEPDAFVRPNIEVGRNCELVEGIPTHFRLLDPKNWLLDASKIPTCATCFRREAALVVGAMPEGRRMGEDWLFWLRLSRQGAFLFQLFSLARVYRHSQNLTNPDHAVTIAHEKLLGLQSLIDGSAGVDLDASQRARVHDLLAQQYGSWRYHLSKLGLRRYIHDIRAHIDSVGGSLTAQILGDRKGVLRAASSSALVFRRKN